MAFCVLAVVSCCFVVSGESIPLHTDATHYGTHRSLQQKEKKKRAHNYAFNFVSKTTQSTAAADRHQFIPKDRDAINFNLLPVPPTSSPTQPPFINLSGRPSSTGSLDDSPTVPNLGLTGMPSSSPSKVPTSLPFVPTANPTFFSPSGITDRPSSPLSLSPGPSSSVSPTAPYTSTTDASTPFVLTLSPSFTVAPTVFSKAPSVTIAPDVTGSSYPFSSPSTSPSPHLSSSSPTVTSPTVGGDVTSSPSTTSLNVPSTSSPTNICEETNQASLANYGKVVKSNTLRYTYALETKNGASSTILTALEQHMSNSLLASVFPECAPSVVISGSLRDRENRRRQLLDAVGISTLPNDIIASNETCSSIQIGDDCAVVLGGLTIYFTNGTSSANFSVEEELSNSYLTIIETDMNNGNYNDAHPDIVNVTFRNDFNDNVYDEVVDESPDPLIETTQPRSNRRRYYWILLAGVVFIFLTVLCVRWQILAAKRNDNREENGSNEKNNGGGYLQINSSHDYAEQSFQDSGILSPPSMDEGEDEPQTWGNAIFPFSQSKRTSNPNSGNKFSPQSDYFV